MKKSRNPKRRRSRMALETVIILGLSLKLALSAAFLIFFHEAPATPLDAATAHAQEQPATPPAGEAPPPAASTDNTLTRQYQGLMDTLRQKEEELNRREKRLEEREKALTLLEQDLQQRIQAIEAEREKIDALVARQAELVEKQKVLKNARIEHLVTAYKGMRPEQAGTLVNNLDDEVAVDILSAMPGRNAGQILAFVEPAKAARLTKALRERKVPTPITPPPGQGQPAAGQ